MHYIFTIRRRIINQTSVGGNLTSSAGNVDNNVFRIKMKAKSFTLNLMEEEQRVFSTKICCDELWHKRVAHFHHIGLMFLQKQNLVKGVPPLENITIECATCQYGKYVRKPFP